MNKSALILKSKGFTLIEILVVIAVLMLITGFAVPSFDNYLDSQSLTQAKNQVVTDLRFVQNKALSGENLTDFSTYWVAKFTANSNSYVFYSTEDTPENACNNPANSQKSELLPSNLEIKNDICVLFSYDNADAVTFPSGNLVRIGFLDNSSCINVSVSSTGLVTDSGVVSCN